MDVRILYESIMIYCMNLIGIDRSSQIWSPRSGKICSSYPVDTPMIPMSSWSESLLQLNHQQQLPSGYVNIAIENGHRNSGITH